MTLKTLSFRPARRIVPLLTGLGLLTLGWASAQVVKKGPTLYQGEPSSASGIRLASWGSGTITEDNKGTFDSGSMSLRIVTHGLYQGASINLAKPVDLGPYVSNKYAYLSIVMVPPPSPTAGGAPGGPGFPGSNGKGGGQIGGGPTTGGGPPGDAETGGGPGSNGSFGGRGQNGSLNSTSVSVKYQTAHAMQNLRVVLVTTKGSKLDMMLPLDSAVDTGAWKRVSIPVALIPRIKADDAQIKEVRLFGDSAGVMRVGNISVLIDDTPITVQSLPNRDLARLASHDFRVTASGGITPLEVSWDWDAADGIQDETQGRYVTHKFRKESIFDQNTNKTLDSVVTVTVKDLYGIKAPAKTKFSVHVTP